MIRDAYGNARFFGLYRGVVADNADPLNQGRLKLKVPQILADTVTEWAWGVEVPQVKTTPPDIDQGVWVMFEGGDPNFPIWVGTFGEYKGAGFPLLLAPVTGGSLIPRGAAVATLPNGEQAVDVLATSTSLTSGAVTPKLNGLVLKAPKEPITVSATAATGTIQFDVKTQADVYYTLNASGNFSLNLRGDNLTTLNNWMSTGHEVTVVFRNTNGATAKYLTGVTIDGSSTTVKWQNGSAPSSGTASAVDVYTLNVVKQTDNTFTVFASVTNFA